MKPLKILLITPQLAIPPSDGGRAAIYFPMKAFTSIAEVWAVIPRPSAENSFTDEQIISMYADLGVKAVILPPVVRESKTDILVNATSPLPFKIKKYFSKESMSIIRRLQLQEEFDLAWITGLHLMTYGEQLKQEFGLPVFLWELNIECDLVRQYANNHSSVAHRLVARWQYPKTLAFQRKAWKIATETFFISDSDVALARELGYQGNNNIPLYAIIPVGPEQSDSDQISRESAVLYPLRLNGTVQNEYSAREFIHKIWEPFASRNDSLYLAISGSTASDLARIHIDVPMQEALRIRPLGFVEDMSLCLRSHRYFVSPTYFGSGLRIKLVEAMGQGCVCLCTPLDYSSLKVFQHGENVFQFENAEAFQRILETLEADPSRVKQVRHSAWQTAHSHFHEKNYLSRIEETWRNHLHLSR